MKPLTRLKKTIEMIGTIKKAIVIVAFTGQNLQTLPQPLGSIQPIFLLGIIMTGRLKKMTET